MDLTVLHEQLLDMYLIFDSICKKYNITYFFDSGSALGAVREHDFIPWDDDIDIAIMRDDYLKLRKVLKKELPAHYKLVEPKDYEPYFFDMIPKLIDLDVPLREETDEDRVYKNYQNRMSLDFIILDSVPDSGVTQRFIMFKSKILYGLLRSRRYKIDYESLDLKEKVLSEIIKKIGLMFSLKKLRKMYFRNTMKYRNIRSNSLIRSNSILYFIGCYQKEDYLETVLFDFHGVKVPLPKGYDRILTRLYGNYMVPNKNYKGLKTHTDE